jgi:cell division protein FtsW
VGTGLGEGIQKRGYLPEDRTDYIFAVICEELGIAGAGLVLALFMGLLWAGYSVARNERDPLLRLWTIGIVATLGLPAMINLLVVTGLAPAKGIALPLISYGGTGWILTAFSLGILMAIDRTQAVLQDEGAQDPADLVAA